MEMLFFMVIEAKIATKSQNMVGKRRSKRERDSTEFWELTRLEVRKMGLNY
jgi:hypothetical protein